MKPNYNDAVKNFQNGKINESKEICNEILKSEPDNFNAYYLLGVIAFQTRNYKFDKLMAYPKYEFQMAIVKLSDCNGDVSLFHPK